MRVLCVGDIIGDVGFEFLKKTLPKVKREYEIDFVIVNGENSAENNGITPSSAEDIFSLGVDVITTGNHVYKWDNIKDYLESNERILRPANYPEGGFGNFVYIIESISSSLAVINIMGTVFMSELDNPFSTIDRVLKNIQTKNIIVDFHGEATSEKAAFANYIDGRVSGVFGTHTHVQTSDERILPKKTAFITDVGMVGPVDSIIGMEIEPVLKRFVSKMPVRAGFASGKAVFGGVVLDIDEKTGRTNTIKRLLIKE